MNLIRLCETNTRGLLACLVLVGKKPRGRLHALRHYIHTHFFLARLPVKGVPADREFGTAWLDEQNPRAEPQTRDGTFPCLLGRMLKRAEVEADSVAALRPFPGGSHEPSLGQRTERGTIARV